MYSFLSWWKGNKIVYITLITIHLCLLVCFRSGRIYGTVVSLNDWWRIKQLLFYLSRLIDSMLLSLKFHSFIIETANIYDYTRRTFMAHKNTSFALGYMRQLAVWWRTITDNGVVCSCSDLPGKFVHITACESRLSERTPGPARTTLFWLYTLSSTSRRMTILSWLNVEVSHRFPYSITTIKILWIVMIQLSTMYLRYYFVLELDLFDPLVIVLHTYKLFPNITGLISAGDWHWWQKDTIT